VFDDLYIFGLDQEEPPRENKIEAEHSNRCVKRERHNGGLIYDETKKECRLQK
jgi:hypothetical protein